MQASIDERGDPARMVKAPPPDVDGLFREHYLTLVRLAVHLVDDQASAEDVVQDVFAAMQRVRTAPGDPLSYLRTAVVNRSRSTLRRRRTVRLFTGRQPGGDRYAEPADAAGERHADRDRILRAVRALPGRQREVIVLRYYEELSVAETSSVLGITAGAVSSSANRALTGLSNALEADHV